MNSSTSNRAAAKLVQPTLRSRAALLLETIKFSHTLFALPFAALAAVWARGAALRPGEALLLLAAMVSARTAAMAANRAADAQFDAMNPRTWRRAVPTGTLSRAAVTGLAALSAASFAGCALAFWPLLGNPWPAILCLPVLAVLMGYSYSKRFTVLCHHWLGLALGLSPVGVWVALRGELAWPPILLGLALLCWTAGFDMLYSLQDLRHDRQFGLCSVPARCGSRSTLTLARLHHLVMIAILGGLYGMARGGWAGSEFHLGPLYLVGLAVLAALLVYEHLLIRGDDLRRLDQAFFMVNAVGSVAFSLLAILDFLV